MEFTVRVGEPDVTQRTSWPDSTGGMQVISSPESSKEKHVGLLGQELVRLRVPDVHVNPIDDPKELVHVWSNRRVAAHFCCICWGHCCPHLQIVFFTTLLIVNDISQQQIMSFYSCFHTSPFSTEQPQHWHF